MALPQIAISSALRTVRQSKLGCVIATGTGCGVGAGVTGRGRGAGAGPGGGWSCGCGGTTVATLPPGGTK